MRAAHERTASGLEARLWPSRSWKLLLAVVGALGLLMVSVVPTSSVTRCEWQEDGGLLCERVVERLFWERRRTSPVAYPGQKISAYMYPSEWKSHAKDESCGLQLDGETHFLPTACDSMVETAMALNDFLQEPGEQPFEQTRSAWKLWWGLLLTVPMLLIAWMRWLTPSVVIFRVQPEEAAFVVERVFAWPRRPVTEVWDVSQAASLRLDPMTQGKGGATSNRLSLNRLDPEGEATSLYVMSAKHLLQVDEIVAPLNAALREAHQALAVTIPT